jgi:hypothetical protein
MKNMIIASTAVLALSGAVGGIAQAQSGRYYDQERDYGRSERLTTGYVDSLNWRINNAAREGRISWREARDLQNELNQVKPLAYRYQTGQARQWEVNRLERTVDRITNEVRD